MFTLTKQWKNVLSDEIAKPYFSELYNRLDAEYQTANVFPAKENVLRALNLTPYDNVRVVILGQDPYHGKGQANGLAFAVNHGVKLPPSLINVYAEIESDLNVKMPRGVGTLLGWQRQGVLLLNTTLTVRESQPFSHSTYGWQTFTDAVISALSRRDEPIVFMLWGAPAKQKAILIDKSKHKILYAPHPSPLSAHRGFFGCKHFSLANEFLLSNGYDPIYWNEVD